MNKMNKDLCRPAKPNSIRKKGALGGDVHSDQYRSIGIGITILFYTSYK